MAPEHGPKDFEMLATSLPQDIAEAAVRRRSAKREPWQIAVKGPLAEEDLILLHSLNVMTPSPHAPLAKIRDPHHTLAKMVAEGHSVVHISAVTGYSPSRIRTLQNDPSFQELVAHYVDQGRLASADIQEQLKHVSLTALAILQERLEDNTDDMSIKELQSLVEMGMDRTGYGPTRQVNVSTTSANVLQVLMESVVSEQQGRIIPREEAHLLIETQDYTLAPTEEGDDGEIETSPGPENCSPGTEAAVQLPE